MKKNKLLTSIGILSLSAISLVGCGKQNNTSNDETKNVSKFPI